MVWNSDLDAQQLAEKLVKYAIEHKSKDNITVMVLVL